MVRVSSSCQSIVPAAPFWSVQPLVCPSQELLSKYLLTDPLYIIRSPSDLNPFIAVVLIRLRIGLPVLEIRLPEISHFFKLLLEIGRFRVCKYILTQFHNTSLLPGVYPSFTSTYLAVHIFRSTELLPGMNRY